LLVTYHSYSKHNSKLDLNEINESKLESLKQKTENMTFYQKKKFNQKTQNTPHCFMNTIDLEIQNSTTLHHAYYKLEKRDKNMHMLQGSNRFSQLIQNTKHNMKCTNIRPPIAEIGRCMHYK
jgi:hypothetical protein